MNVLFLTHRLPYAPNRGDRIRAYYLLQEMSQAADVSLFSLVHDAAEAEKAGEVPFATRVATSHVPRVRNLVRAALRPLSRQPLTHLLLDAPDVAAQISALVAERPPDVVVAYCSGMAKFALRPPLARVPFVLDMVDVDSTKWAEMATRSSGPRAWIYAREARCLGAFEALAVRRAQTTLVVNEREHAALKRITREGHVQVVENGIDIDAFRAPATASRRAPHVVFCGVLNYAPNEAGVLWFLRDVWPAIVAARPDARFVIVGAGPTRALEEAARRASSVDLVGAVPAVQPHLWNAAVSVAPLHLARGLQNKVLEALAAGLPVVTTRAVFEGLPAEVHAACDCEDGAEGFANAVIAELNATDDERAARVHAANLSELRWSSRLHGIGQILRDAAGQRT